MSTTPVGDWIRKRWPDNPGATHYLGPGDDPGCCAGGHARCTYEAGWREALLSLAAWFDRRQAETATETAAHATAGDDDAGRMAYGASSAWRDAAREARLRAQRASSGAGTAAPVSQPAQDAHGDLTPARIPAEALNAAIAALSERTAQDEGTPGMDAARWHALVALEAALPHLTPAGMYLAGVKAERERCAELAEEHGATYTECLDPNCDATHVLSFAALIRHGEPS